MEPDNFNEKLESSLKSLGVKIIKDDEIVKLKPAIGQGGFGKVYKGTYQGKDVAIKKIKLMSEDDSAIDDIINEMRIVVVFQHPRFPKFYGLWKNKNYFHLIFEFIKGPTLKEAYETMTKKEKLSVIVQLCQILYEIHQKKLFHRDIKPGNIMIEEGNIVKLIDFGISKIASKTVTYTGNQTGTVPYMSPEYFDVDIDDYLENNENSSKPIAISSKLDIWSTGCLISEIFSGKAPWSNKCRNENAIKKNLTMGGAFPIPESIDEEVKEVIKKCTQKDPTQRCSAAEIGEDLQKAMQNLD
jgi:serine/threonine-protein kinase